ncbi:MAG: hypothetical protein OEZ01_16065 [Candidatus Heimdallarchaeota archaeon]|nr:hypothetical protein [Anaerolineae bacterium]MDH5647526.1 hypothetical protein [Candidatus Heimdallarchaeota archaeon]
MTDNESNENNIANSLNQISSMLAYNIIRNNEWKEKTNGEKIFFLHQFGYSKKDISMIVGTTPGNVQKEISIRKNKK